MQTTATKESIDECNISLVPLKLNPTTARDLFCLAEDGNWFPASMTVEDKVKQSTHQSTGQDDTSARGPDLKNGPPPKRKKTSVKKIGTH